MIQVQKMTDSILLAPAAQTAAATRTANLDTLGSDYATIRIFFASEVNTSAIGPTISILESDDTVVTNFATIVANRTAEDLTAARILRYEVDCRGRKRYLRLALTTETHTTNDVITACSMATLSRKELSPTATSELASAAVIV